MSNMPAQGGLNDVVDEQGVSNVPRDSGPEVTGHASNNNGDGANPALSNVSVSCVLLLHELGMAEAR